MWLTDKQTVNTSNQTAWGLYGVGGDVDEVDNWHSLKGSRLHELKGLELDSTLGGIGDSSNQGFKPTSGPNGNIITADTIYKPNTTIVELVNLVDYKCVQIILGIWDRILGGP